MDWIITVPLMALKFPSLVGKKPFTDSKIPRNGIHRYLFHWCALIMIGFGYLGESGSRRSHGAAGGWAGLILVVLAGQ